MKELVKRLYQFLEKTGAERFLFLIVQIISLLILILMILLIVKTL